MMYHVEVLLDYEAFTPEDARAQVLALIEPLTAAHQREMGMTNVRMNPLFDARVREIKPWEEQPPTVGGPCDVPPQLSEDASPPEEEEPVVNTALAPWAHLPPILGPRPAGMSTCGGCLDALTGEHAEWVEMIGAPVEEQGAEQVPQPQQPPQ
jgi:hypothetical protein